MVIRFTEVIGRKIRKSDLSLMVKLFLLFLTSGTCHMCGTFLDVFADKSVVDHLVAFIRSASNSIRNLGFACATCNNVKGDRFDSTQNLFKGSFELPDEWVERYFTRLLENAFIRGEISPVITLADNNCSHRDKMPSELAQIAKRTIARFVITEDLRDAKRGYENAQRHLTKPV